MVCVEVDLREEVGGARVSGGALILDDNTAALWPLPCTVPLLPGKHMFEVRHPTRSIVPPNPRVEDVVVSTDPLAPVQIVCFEASLLPPTGVA